MPSHAGSTLVAPTAGDVGLARSIFVHNFDTSNAHTFTSTDAACYDNNAATVCRFDAVLPVGSWGLFAKTVQITASKFTVGTTYSFKCRFHAGEGGTFTVTP
jgi:extradiol dioxygenase family protein